MKHTRFILGLGGLAVFGIVTGFVIFREREVPMPLVFEEQQIDLTGILLVSGEEVERTVILKNTSQGDIRLTSIESSCGCLTLAPKTQTGFPFVLRSGNEAPLLVRITTLGRLGRQVFHVRVRGETEEGSPLPHAALEIVADILPPLFVSPQAAHFFVAWKDREKPVKCTFVLADLWPEPGLGIKEITSSAGDRISWEVIPSRGELVIGDAVLHKRHELMVIYRPEPSRKEFNETITVVPDNSRAKPVTVRLWGELQPRFECQPESLTYHAWTGETQTRVIYYRAYDPSCNKVAVVRAPSWVTVACTPTKDGVTKMTVVFTSNEPGKHSGKIVINVGDGQDELSVPVTAIVNAR